MKRFLLIAACAFLSLGFLTSCQKEEASVLDIARELTKELQAVTDHKSAEMAAPRVEALYKRLQNAMARPYDSGMSGSSLLRSCDKDATDQEGAQLAEALRDLAREIGRVQASLPVDRYSDAEVAEKRLKLSVGACNGSSYADPAAARYKAADDHMQGETERNAVPYPGGAPVCYGCEKLVQAFGYSVSPNSVAFFTFDSADDVVNTPASANPKAEDTEGAEGEADSSSDSGADSSSDDSSSSDDTPEPTPAADDDDDGGLPSIDDSSDDSPSDDSSDDSSFGSDDEETADLEL